MNFVILCADAIALIYLLLVGMSLLRDIAKSLSVIARTAGDIYLLVAQVAKERGK